jgi:ADP-heptose:LPS heptosyltransferase
LLKDFYKIDVKNINEKSNKIPTTYFCDNELLGKKYIVIAVLASLQSKSRTVEQWVESLYTLFIYFPSHLFVFVGSNDANNYFNNIQKNFKPDEKDKFINRIGCYNFNELCSTITNADLFIGLQSGLSHIAFRQNIPSILFSAEVQKYFEISRINFINLLSLKRCKCKEHDFHYCNKDFFACTRDVKNDEFVNAIKKILSL